MQSQQSYEIHITFLKKGIEDEKRDLTKSYTRHDNQDPKKITTKISNTFNYYANVNDLEQDLDLIICYWKFAGMAAKTIWMPNTTHATQKSPMANLFLAACTYPTNIISKSIPNKSLEIDMT